MPPIQLGRLHRLALAVEDIDAADQWFRDVLGATRLTDPNSQRGPRFGYEADLEGVESRLLRLGGFPIILLSKGIPDGPVDTFLRRYGPAVHSLAWETTDLWSAQNELIQAGIGIGAVNVPGRHFFMHPRNTHGILMELTDQTFGENGNTGHNRLGIVGLAWTTALVADASAAAHFLSDTMGATRVECNAKGHPSAADSAIDVQLGDVTVRLVSGNGSTYYGRILAGGRRFRSFALRVDDLAETLATLQSVGVSTIAQDSGLAFTDPATTFGLALEWTTATG